MSCLRYLCLLAVFGWFSRFCCFIFLRLVCPMLQISLDCPCLIATSGFSNVYLKKFECDFCSRQSILDTALCY